MKFSFGTIFLPVKALFNAGLFFLFFSISGLHAQSIKDIRPSVLCVNEEVTITGKDLNRVTRINFNGIVLYLSNGDFTAVNKGTLQFPAPSASVTDGEELVTTIIYTGFFGEIEADSKEILMTINPLPVIPSNPVGSSYCEGTAVSFVSVDDPGQGFQIDWYDSSTGGSLLGSGIFYAPSGSGTFYAETVNINTGCVSENRVSVTVEEIPGPAPPSGAVSSSYCEGEPVSSVSVNNPGTGYRIDWYSVSTGGTILYSGTQYTPLQAGTYYAEVLNINTGCRSLSRASATVTENPGPPNATNPVNASFCGDDPIPSIRVDDPGNEFMVVWFTTATGSTLASGIASGNHGEIFTPTNGVSASYYAEVTNNRTGCISEGRTRASVEKDPPSCTNTDISSFYFNEQNDPSDIDEVNHRIHIVVPYGVSITNLIAFFTLAPGATADIDGKIQQSGVTQNDFSQSLTYRILAADKVTTEEWTVIVVPAPNEATQIISYSFAEQTGPAIIDRGNNIISVEIEFMADITYLIADFTLSDGATATVNGIEQISGITANDFSRQVIYTVRAQDQISTADWRVRVSQRDIVDNEDPVILAGDLPDLYPVSADSISTHIAVTDNIGIRRVVLRYKVYQSTEWEEVRLSPSDSLYSYYFKESMIGGHGMTYYFKAYDYKDNTDSTKIYNMVLKYDNQNSPAIPGLSFGGSIENYQIISIPMDLEEKNIEQIFDELMPYDIKRWRLFHYNNGLTNEFMTSLSTIYPSRGYWLIVRNQKDIHTGAGTTNRIENGNGFAMTLQPGWNQVGNPYNFEISWDDVIDFNNNPSIGRIKLYENGILMESDKVPPFRGGFVFLSGVQSAFLNIPPNPGFKSAWPSGNARMGIQGHIDQTEWLLPIRVTSGNYSSSVYALGMHPESLTGYDEKDEPLLPIPHEISGFDLYFVREGEIHDKLNRDIVKPAEFQTWILEVKKYNGAGSITLQWENVQSEEDPNKLVLLDEVNGRLIDMQTSDAYTFYAAGIHHFRIFYGTGDRLSTETLPLNLLVGEIYPNPFKDELNIPVALPDHNGPWQVELSLSDLNGKVVQYRSGIHVNPGYMQISWKLNDSHQYLRGFYFLKILIASGREKQIIYKKIMKY